MTKRKLRFHSLLLAVIVIVSGVALAAQDGKQVNVAETGHQHEQGVEPGKVHQAERKDAHPGEDSAVPSGEDGGEEGNRVHLSDAQRSSAGIVVEALSVGPVAREIQAPGEVRLNSYSSSRISPRIEAQVVKRHVRLGDVVKSDTPMVTLSSVSMAQAQGELLVAASEWARVRKLGRKVVAERRHIEAEVAIQHGRAKLLAFGLTPRQVNELVKQGEISRADGRFTLLASQAGTVIRDDFVVGQMVGSGDLLFELTDVSRLWVEARVNPGAAANLSLGAAATVLAGSARVEGKVIQINHSLDEVTRTLAVRLEIPNPGDQLRPGQFVTVSIRSDQSGENAMSLPLDAVMRSPDGDWQVYIEEEPGEFEPKEVELIRQLAGLAVIEGIAPGTKVVTRGAFFVQSELAKSGFDVHNH